MIQNTYNKLEIREMAGARLADISDVRFLTMGRSSEAWLVVHGDQRSVLRAPIPNSGRRMSYRSEAHIGQLLADAGHPVCRWETTGSGADSISIGPELPGTPVDYDDAWSTVFAGDLAAALYDLHHLPSHGFGPLVEVESIVGGSATELDGILERWSFASIWPFDGSDFDNHPIHEVEPELASQITPLRGEILTAIGEPYGLVHSDLHHQHLLVHDERLSGVLDFGAAFIGSLAWDFALVHWYYGHANALLIDDAYPSKSDLRRRGILLAFVVGLYKLAKSPSDPVVIRRLQELLNSPLHSELT